MKSSDHVLKSSGKWCAAVAIIFTATLTFAAPALSAKDGFKVKTTIAGPGNYIVEVEGAPTDHPDRVQGLAQLYAAKSALKLGFGFFRITDTKGAIRCIKSKEFGTFTGGQAKVGHAFLAAKKQQKGFLDTQKFIAANEKKLLREPTKAQKQKVIAAFISGCLANVK
jgi:hypothetical protein